MKPDDFVRLVKNMLEAQKAYFRSRDAIDLKNAKQAERLVDQAIRHMIGQGQQELFAR